MLLPPSFSWFFNRGPTHTITTKRKIDYHIVYLEPPQEGGIGLWMLVAHDGLPEN